MASIESRIDKLEGRMGVNQEPSVAVGRLTVKPDFTAVSRRVNFHTYGFDLERLSESPPDVQSHDCSSGLNFEAIKARVEGNIKMMDALAKLGLGERARRAKRLGYKVIYSDDPKKGHE